MKNKFLFFGLFIFTFIIISGITKAACVTPINDLYVNESVTFCGGTYYINDTAQLGVIIVNGTNIIIDGNGSTIIGNGSGRGIQWLDSKYTKVTIKNLAIKDYFYLERGLAFNCSFINLTMTNGYSFYFLGSSSKIGNRIENSTFSNTTMYIDLSENNIIKGNQFICPTNFCTDGLTWTLNVRGGNNNTIEYNDFRNSQVAIMANINTNNLTIRYNNFTRHDIAIKYQSTPSGGNRNYIYNNTFQNNTNSIDGYLLDIEGGNGKALDIYDNQFLESTDVSLLFWNMSGVNIQRNTFNMVCKTNRNAYNLFTTAQQNEPCSAIEIKQLYKTYCYSAGCSKNLDIDNSSNFIIENNSFTGDPIVYVYLQGATNISLINLPSYWYRSFKMDNLTNTTYGVGVQNKVAKSELYINNAVDEVSNGMRFYNTTDLIFNLYEGYANQEQGRYYGIRKTSMLFYNRNDSTVYGNSVPYYVYVYNLSSPYNDVKNVVNGSIIAYDVNDYSIILSPNGQIMIFDAGVTPNPECSSSVIKITESLGEIATWFVIIVVVAALSIILGIIFLIQNGSFNISLDGAIPLIFSIVLSGILLTIGIIIITTVGSTC